MRFKNGSGIWAIKRLPGIRNAFSKPLKANTAKGTGSWVFGFLFYENWPSSIGAYLLERSRDPLYRLAHSKNLWERRISIIATFYFIKRNDVDDTLKLSEILKQDPEDLIQKAVGWMLREIGNRNQATEERFLSKHYREMPRTMLRYAIEKFPEDKRQAYLKGRV